MKKIAFFIVAALVALFVLSKLPQAAQARTIVVPSQSAGTVVSGG